MRYVKLYYVLGVILQIDPWKINFVSSFKRKMTSLIETEKDEIYL